MEQNLQYIEDLQIIKKLLLQSKVTSCKETRMATITVTIDKVNDYIREEEKKIHDFEIEMEKN